MSSRAALAAESSSYIFISSSACWIITQFWHPLMQHNSRGGGGGGGGGLGGFFSGLPALTVFSAYCGPVKEQNRTESFQSQEWSTAKFFLEHPLTVKQTGEENKKIIKQWILSWCTSNSHWNLSNSFISSSLNKDDSGLDTGSQKILFYPILFSIHYLAINQSHFEF